MSGFDDAFSVILGAEGVVLSTDRNDPGNWTGGAVGNGVFKGSKFGISAASFPDVDIANLTIDQAKMLAKGRYWDKYFCDQFDPRIGLQVFDAAYNGGHPAQWLQGAAGVDTDGIIGAQTIAAVRRSDPRVIVMLFLADRFDYWVTCKAWATEGAGWVHRGTKNLRLGAT